MFTYNKEPDSYWRHLDKRGYLDKMYMAISKVDDLADLALTALDVLKQTDTMPKFEKHTKSDIKSNLLREEGNRAYSTEQFRTALEYYNKALLYAPDNSKSLRLAYSNRSALLFKVRCYTACLKDIETCFRLGCSKDITEKLKKRKEECEKLVRTEKNLYSDYPDNFFKIATSHPDLLCLSADVEIVDEDVPQIVAAKDIKIGTMLSVEQAFTTILNPVNHFLCCYYCHRMSLNLKPCRDCCFALFCDDQCKDKCMQESHTVECHIMHLIYNVSFGPYSRISFRTILKIRQKCKSWKEFVDASYCVGEERMKNSSFNEIFDARNPFSMLCFAEKREIKISSLYNFAYTCATFLKHLMDISLYFPYQTDERNDAIRSVGRMSMRLLLLFYNKIELNNVACDYMTGDIKPEAPNYGYFSFASKLRHTCDSNLLPIALNNRLALMALQPIKKGKELTISYIDHAYEVMHEPPAVVHRSRVVELYRFATICHCPVCTGAWKFKPKKLNKEQRKCFEKWMMSAPDSCPLGQKAFDSTCRAMEVLYGMSQTKEHHLLHVKLRSFLIIYQFISSKNYVPYDKM